MPADRNTNRASGSWAFSQSLGFLGGGTNRGARGAARSNGDRGGGARGTGRGRSRGQQGSTGRGGGPGRGHGRGRGRGRYTRPTYTSDVSLYFPGTRGSYVDEIDVAVLDAPREASIKKIHFGDEFSIQDRHLQLIQSRTHLMESLECLELGDSDTGHGGSLTNPCVQAFLASAPNLRVLRLDACNALTDATLTKAFECCPRLERVRLTGHDRSSGNVRGPALVDLKTRTDLALNLAELVLVDQSVKEKDMKALTKARKGLSVMTGETVGDGYASQMIAGMTGGGMSTTYRNGRMVGFDGFF